MYKNALLYLEQKGHLLTKIFKGSLFGFQSFP